MTADLLAFSTNFSSYIRKDSGEVVENYNLFYFNPVDIHEEKLNRGYFPVSLRLPLTRFKPSSSFETLPALYSVEQRLLPRRGFGGRNQTTASLYSATLKQPYSFFSSENSAQFDSSLYLVLGGSYKNAELDGRPIRGIKLFVLSPFFEADNGLTGHALLEPFLQQTNWTGFPELPGYYHLEFRDIRGQGGQAISQLFGKEFYEKFDLESCKIS